MKRLIILILVMFSICVQAESPTQMGTETQVKTFGNWDTSILTFPNRFLFRATTVATRPVSDVGQVVLVVDKSIGNCQEGMPSINILLSDPSEVSDAEIIPGKVQVDAFVVHDITIDWRVIAGEKIVITSFGIKTNPESLVEEMKNGKEFVVNYKIKGTDAYSGFSMNGFGDAWERITKLCEAAEVLDKQIKIVSPFEPPAPVPVNPLKF